MSGGLAPRRASLLQRGGGAGAPVTRTRASCFPSALPGSRAGPGCARGVLLAPLEQAPSGSGGCQEIKNDFLPCFQTQQARFTECVWQFLRLGSAGLPLLCCCCGSCSRGCPLCLPLEELPFGGPLPVLLPGNGLHHHSPLQTACTAQVLGWFGLVWL